MPDSGTRAVLVASLDPWHGPPSQEIAGAAAETVASDAASHETPLADGQPIRVLLADDHPILRKVLAHQLRKEPRLKVVGAACDGQEALEMVAELRPDVVLMDITMPRMDGIEATRQIALQHPDVRVIGLSMHEEDDLMVAMQEAGAVAYLKKGLPVESLLSAIFG